MSNIIGNRIKKIREERGLTQKLLAARAGMIETQIQKYEYGEKIPRIKQLERLADALDVDVEFLQPFPDTSEAIFALIYDLIHKNGDVMFDEKDGYVYIGINKKLGDPEHKRLIDAMESRKGKTIEEFREWLLNQSLVIKTTTDRERIQAYKES